MPIFRLAVGAQNAGCDAIVDLVDIGGVGDVKIFNGTIPADPSVALSGQLQLAVIPFAGLTAFGNAGAVTDGQADDLGFTPDVATVAGTATWARVYNGTGVDPGDAVFDMDCGIGTETMVFTPTNIFAALGTADITSMSVTVQQ